LGAIRTLKKFWKILDEEDEEKFVLEEGLILKES